MSDKLKDGAEYTVTKEFAHSFNNPAPVSGRGSIQTFFLREGQTIKIAKRWYDKPGTVSMVVDDRAITVPVDKIALLV